MKYRLVEMLLTALHAAALWAAWRAIEPPSRNPPQSQARVEGTNGEVVVQEA